MSGQSKDSDKKDVEINLTQQLYEDFFLEADKNGDGILNFEELYMILGKYKVVKTLSDIRKMMKDVSKTGETDLTFEEFMKAMGFENVKEPKKKPAKTEQVKQEQVKKVESAPTSSAPPAGKKTESYLDDPRVADLRIEFKKYDKGGKGEIEKKDLRTILMSAKKYFTEKEIDNMVKNAEKDGSKNLKYEDFLKNSFSPK